MNKKKLTFTSESVTEGHPDKISDQISDGILDKVLEYDREIGLSPYRLKKDDRRGSRVACETFVSVGLVLIGGEITTETYVNFSEVARNIVRDIGYTDPNLGFEYKSLCLLNAINEQSSDIALGVDKGGAGDQGLMVGYATTETEELMPLPITLAHKLTRQITKVRKEGILDYLKPDGKSQVTVVYEGGKPKRVDTVVISSQHDDSILDSEKKNISDDAREEIINNVVDPVIPEEFMNDDIKYLINPTGRFIIGGPQSDTGMTGRKIIVDTYGGLSYHGGGAFSGKDPTKVDRSASYAARYVAKNIVAAGLAEKCNVHLSYAIGVKEPINVTVETHGTSELPEDKIEQIIKKGDIFNLSPIGIIDMLDLWNPIYKQTACYGHFGRDIFPWEKTDKVDELKEEAGKFGA